jgi:hypothetical protein
MSASRRVFLRGLGTVLALPALDARAARPAPLRLVFLMFPNGAIADRWRPAGGAGPLRLGPTLAPLGSLARQVQVFSGFAHDNAAGKGDGAGDHVRASATFLTGCHPHKTAGAGIRAGVSADQIAARAVGHLTRLPSLELGTEKARRSGLCDNGYSCAYENVSWASESLPLPPETDPRRLFERLFGAGTPAERQRGYVQRQRQRRSVVDFVLDEARTFARDLGPGDRRKLDEYLTGVRAVEADIEKAERMKLPRTAAAPPDAIPEEHGAHVRLMFDLLALALATDSTRVATFALANEGSNRSFGEIGVLEGHHHLSHHQGQADKIDKVAKIDAFYVAQLARFLRALDAGREGDGRSVLDHSMIVYGCAIADGDRHTHRDLPVLLAGGGGGRLRPGRHVELAGARPLANLFLTLLGFMGAPARALGDATAPLGDV